MSEVTTSGARAVLTDIEGTTSSIAFVKDVLFPYARARLPRFIENHQNDPEVLRWLDATAREEVAAAVERAKAAPPPSEDTAFTDVWADGGAHWRT